MNVTIPQNAEIGNIDLEMVEVTPNKLFRVAKLGVLTQNLIW